ncbi:Pre-rRNA-processing protein TSR1 like protein [Pitangus sulphuratus]|nr:Pre-rRNA-processing protein TSR1 like protein [Pitangus sulphuratus]
MANMRLVRNENVAGHGSKEVKGKTHTYYQVLIDARDCPHISQRSQTEAVTFLANHDDSRALYAIPGLDYVSHEDILPYSSTDQVPIQHELFERFLMYDQTKVPPFVARDTLCAWQEKNHPWLELSDVHRETTENIRVTVIPFYMGMREAQNSHVYWWRYCIRLENLDSEVVQLRERHWRIFSLSGTLETVRGRGVVGREPVLSKEQPAFQYSSHVSLQASSGHMWGTFRFERPDGSHFDVRIPPFSLESNKDEKTPPSGLHWNLVVIHGGGTGTGLWAGIDALQWCPQVLAEKRSLGSRDGPPHLVAVVLLHSRPAAQDTLRLLQSQDSAVVRVNEGRAGGFALLCPRLKQRWRFVTAQAGDLHTVLDLAKVADSLLFILDAVDGWDSAGEHCLSCLFAQGLPSYALAVPGGTDLPPKKRIDARKKLAKAIEKRFPEAKLFPLNTEQESSLLLRHLSTQKQRHLTFRDRRAHLLAYTAEFVPGQESDLVGTLKVSGFVRGQTLDVNSLVHIVGHGDFQVSQVDAPPDPLSLNPRVVKGQKRSQDMEIQEDPVNGTDEMEEDVKVLMKADPSKQESLQSEVVPDPMEGEQTWPTEEELQEAEDSLKANRRVVKVPKGTSKYQAAWIVDDGEEGSEKDDDEDDDIDDDLMEEAVSQEGESSEEEPGEEESETMTVSECLRDDQYDEKMEEDEQMLERYKQERMDEMFPDEVDTPRDVPARVRFQKYRGLKSFRTSPWDPKENLPRDYARIFQFQDFSRTRKHLFRQIEKEETEGASMSVLNFLVRRHLSNTEPVRAKEELIFHCGFRRFRASPLFSQHTSADKHKLERFLRPDAALVVTVYAPITFPPASVLLFKQRSNGMHDLIATGSLLSVDPDRIVIKRLVLSGHPFKIFTKTAVVRYMFFNREDVMWFKPVELRTKWGRRGHIKEPLGTHGHMKCHFDGQLKSQDTVLLNLYKRVFPKWTYDPHVPEPVPWVRSESALPEQEEEME